MLESRDITLGKVIVTAFRYKLLNIAIMVVFAVVGILYAKSLPNIYSSYATLSPASKESNNSLNMLAGQFGGLASLAGVNLDSPSNDNVTLAIEILDSRQFIDTFVRKHGLLIELMAVNGWNMSDNTLAIDDKIYSVTDKDWVRTATTLRTKEPTSMEIYSQFSSLFSVKRNQESGMITVQLEHYSPFIAQQWLAFLIDDINEYMKLNDQRESERSVKYLEEQLTKTKLADFRVLMYQMLDEQTKTLMFSNIRDEYVFKVVDPPLVPETKSKPRKMFIVLLFVVFGFVVLVVTSIVLAYYGDKPQTNLASD